MKVKTLIAHDNAFDLKPVGTHEHRKPVGSVYELPDNQAQNLIDQKIVEAHGEAKPAK
ncbi:hypothetical protein GGQ97_002310 [Sphingomonas kaistensis]|uniref:Uncharacterized protein n=1 Tax=Sphingomonas kaistensis TaxID=298708 RepID=A0A7X6BHV4_9SPHN|nr:hypothetical protein [Sphingomonas kaistensis]NJC06517.1 hypothetical protein [Sphingomonas kaistensis]